MWKVGGGRITHADISSPLQLPPPRDSSKKSQLFLFGFSALFCDREVQSSLSLRLTMLAKTLKLFRDIQLLKSEKSSGSR